MLHDKQKTREVILKKYKIAVSMKLVNKSLFIRARTDATSRA